MPKTIDMVKFLKFRESRGYSSIPLTTERYETEGAEYKASQNLTGWRKYNDVKLAEELGKRERINKDDARLMAMRERQIAAIKAVQEERRNGSRPNS